MTMTSEERDQLIQRYYDGETIGNESAVAERLLDEDPSARALLESLGEPIMSSTLQLPGDDLPLTDVYEIDERIGNRIDLIIDGGPTGIEPTTVIDLSAGSIDVLRVGRGDVSSLV